MLELNIIMFVNNCQRITAVQNLELHSLGYKMLPKVTIYEINYLNFLIFTRFVTEALLARIAIDVSASVHVVFM